MANELNWEVVMCMFVSESEWLEIGLWFRGYFFFAGAQIIDLMMLVVDVTKGIQTQTAECLVIGEILCDKMIVALNKVDLLPEAKRQTTIEKASTCPDIL